MATARARTPLVGFAALAFFTLLAGDFWRNLISWWGWGVLVGVLTLISLAILIRSTRSRRNTGTTGTTRAIHLDWRRMPRMLGLFLLLALVSIAWSAYPGVSAIAVVAQWATGVGALLFAVALDWPQLVRALGIALRFIIGLSFVFELIVSIFVRHPVLPFWTNYGDEKVPKAFYWSRDLLFHGGQIQGILGNSNLLAMCALLALIVFGIQRADRTSRPIAGTVWIVLAAAAFVLSRSSTVIIATAFTAVVLAFALWARAIPQSKRMPLYASGFAAALVAVGVVWALWGRILELFGKSEDLTGRLDIWNSVIGLAHQHPVFGWGWISYWAPWIEPFKGLAVRHGVEYLQAHDVWLDVWMQLGIVGLVIFALLVATTLMRSWFFAVDRPRHGLEDREPFTAASLLPLLVLAAYLAQSVAESRLLIEAGWMLLVLFCVKTKLARP
ncbi:O-antigen ligase family protein [Microbacterium sp. STN6]|uniref:O-antigen ligase family protein n=1 Tax=Microbacterium sp. STN6 TaxID=2995588 RepID=UPI00226099C2|nr:O-antigen ligase family protein [Microbacterium sp. STN6]MCX7521060.1 O-antigen ligase family protein [Microbacterium sp. STN6]